MNDEDVEGQDLIASATTPPTPSAPAASKPRDSAGAEPSWFETASATLSSTTGRVCVVLFLDVLAFSVVIPVLPNLILEMVDGDAGRAAWLQGLAASLDGAIKFFVQPFLGRLSDTVGRKPILYYSLIGSAVSFLLYVIAPTVETLFVSHVMHGLTQCTFLICMSAVADDAHDPNDPSRLTHSFGMVGVALGVAFVLGPVIGGSLSVVLGNRAIYAISSLLFAFSVWALRFVMQETLPESLRKPFDVRDAIPLKSARTVFSKSRGLLILAFAYFLCSFTVGVYGLWIMYSKVRYGWGPMGGGVLMSLNGVIVVFGQGYVIRKLIPTYTTESVVSVVSYASHGALFLMVGLAPTGWAQLLAVAVFGIPSALGEPAIKSVMAHLVSPDEQGALQGVLGSVYTLAQVIAPTMFSALFSYAISSDLRAKYRSECPEGYEPHSSTFVENVPPCGGIPGLPFYVMGILFLLAAYLMRIGLAVVQREHAAVDDEALRAAPGGADDPTIEMGLRRHESSTLVAPVRGSSGNGQATKL